MASSDPSGLAKLVIPAFLVLALFPAPAVAQSNQQVTICQATGSQSNPWVFTTIDARDLAEHLARGDFQAKSIADCPGAQAARSPTPVAAVGAAQGRATSTPAVARAETPAAARQQGGGGNATSNAVGSQAANTATASPSTPTAVPTRTPVSASTTPEQNVEVAGAQATPEPRVSTLPKSGGEPDRPLLALALLGLIGAGTALRRLGRRGRNA
jgi:hypothetical protein